MAISRITQGAAAGTNAAVTVAEGQLLIVFAARAGSTTAPSLPANFTNGPTNTTGANSGGGTNSSFRWGYQVAPGGGLSNTGTWTNASDVAWIVLDGEKAASFIGTTAKSDGNNSQTSVIYNAVTRTVTEVGQWLIAFGWRNTGIPEIATAPAGMTNHASNPNPNPYLAVHSTDGPRLTDWPQTTVTGGSGAKHLSLVVEVFITHLSMPARTNRHVRRITRRRMVK